MGWARQQALSTKSSTLLSFSSNTLCCRDSFLQVLRIADSPDCEFDRRVLAYVYNEDAIGRTSTGWGKVISSAKDLQDHVEKPS